MVDTHPGTDKGARQLKRYWTVGVGGQVKIRWGAPGDWTRCVAELGKYVGVEEAKRMCANYHHEMTGMWPGSKLNK